MKPWWRLARSVMISGFIGEYYKMHLSKNCTSASLICSLLFAAVGCGPPDFYTLSGTVTSDGVPLPFIQITLAPDMIDSTRPPMALTDSTGKFEIKTGRNRGVPPGSYTVQIEDPAFADGGTTPKKTDAYYDQYQYACLRYSTNNSDLKYEADAHRTDYELKLDTKEPSKPLKPLRAVENTTDQE